jgi:hypothetical protein
MPIVGETYQSHEPAFGWRFTVEEVFPRGSFRARSEAGVAYLFEPGRHLNWDKLTDRKT